MTFDLVELMSASAPAVICVAMLLLEFYCYHNSSDALILYTDVDFIKWMWYLENCINIQQLLQSGTDQKQFFMEEV